MDTEKSLEWLEDAGLYKKAKRQTPIFKKVFRQCLEHDGEKALIIGDTGDDNRRLSSILSASYYSAAQSMGIPTELYLRDAIAKMSERTTQQILNAMKNHGKNNLILSNLSNKFGKLNGLGPSFRKFCYKKGHRFVSATSLGYIPESQLSTITNAIDVDYNREFKRHAKLKAIMDEAETLRVTTDSGTDVTFDVKGMKALANDGNYSEPGSGGNMPAGEVYIPPRGKGVEGRVVIDGSARTKDETILVKTPITLDIKKGMITKMTGADEAKALMRTLRWAMEKAKYPWGIKRIGELGIGLNKNAKIIGSTLIDEKSFGSAHVAIGSNAWFGGSIYAIIHLDQVFKNPKLEADGTRVKLKQI